MGIEEFKSDHSWLSPVDYENLLEQVLQLGRVNTSLAHRR